MKKIVIATNNEGKLREIKEILNRYELMSLKEVQCEIEVEEDKETFEENAFKKAKEVFEKTNMPCIADDSGLCINVFEGWPGVNTARFLGKGATQKQKNDAILEKMSKFKGEERKAKVKCVIVYYYKKDKYITAKGEIEGRIAEESRGKNGFGFDEIFELNNNKTLAELTKEEKNMLSARKLALENLKKQLTNE